MKLYRVTVYDFGSYGPRGMTINGTGLNTWAFTDKAQALRHYNNQMKSAVKEKRKASLRLQIIATAERMTTELWIEAIVKGEVPYEVLRNIRQDYVNPVDLALSA